MNNNIVNGNMPPTPQKPPIDTHDIKDAEYVVIDSAFPMCPSLRVSSQGQVTIPKNVMRALGIVAGDYVDLVEVRKCKK